MDSSKTAAARQKRRLNLAGEPWIELLVAKGSGRADRHHQGERVEALGNRVGLRENFQ